MAVLEHLEPKAVFSYFEQLCGIPHGSHNTKLVSDWLVNFAESHSLKYIQDSSNNVIMFKPATPGYENAESVILQGHMDMVCECASDCAKDMSVEGLDLAIDGDLVYAKGTTLGGDDGIAVAVMLALLDAGDLAHPALECVFTVDEEVGMLGAMAIDVSMLKGRRLLNMDSEVEGIFTVSCAGGNVTRCDLPVKRTVFSGTGLKITVTGLIGGHSGVEIDKGRANANMLMGRILCSLNDCTEMRLVSVNGGQKDNVITRESVATVIVADAEAAKSICAAMETAFQNEYAVTDCGITVLVEDTDAALPMDKASTDRAVCMINCLPGGIQAMSADIDGLVQTSLNMGILATTDSMVTASFGVRSSIATQKDMLVQRLRCLMSALGGSVEVFGDYPGWQYRQNSPLRDLMVEVFTDQYGHAPVVAAIHAGLECGLLSDKLPGLDCISYGPDLKEIHTCRETMSIASVQRVWKMTTEVLRRMK